ncbi:MAG: oligopeptide/dipeptide ABC transporter ATP-binding protein, partial [Atribacterota bacterium]
SLPILARYAHNILVLYAGTVVEYGPKNEMLTKPSHPYTRVLIDSMPKLTGKREKRLKTIKGFSQDLLKSELEKCIFSDLCNSATEKCFSERPKLSPVNESNKHLSNCFLN